MTALEAFRYAGAEIRMIMIDGDPWFVAADIATVLGYSATEAMTRSLDVDEKGMQTLQTLGGPQIMSRISEPGLYGAIMRSRVPQARNFNRWVKHEVLPAIHRTGTYSMAPALSEEEIVHRALTITQRRVDELTMKVAELEPVAAHAETFRQAEGLRTIADVANDFKAHCAQHFEGVKVLHRDVYDHAGRLGLIIRGNSVRNNQPTAQAIEAGWARAHRVVFPTNTRGEQTNVSTRLTPRGEARPWDGLAAWLGQHGTLELAK